MYHMKAGYNILILSILGITMFFNEKFTKNMTHGTLTVVTFSYIAFVQLIRYSEAILLPTAVEPPSYEARKQN